MYSIKENVINTGATIERGLEMGNITDLIISYTRKKAARTSSRAAFFDTVRLTTNHSEPYMYELPS